MGKEKLVIEGISKEFGTNEVLRNISFTVNEGEFLSILGPSGCGKTTILRILIGLEQASKGTIKKDGVDITGFAPAKRGMGIVFPVSYTHLDVYKRQRIHGSSWS